MIFERNLEYNLFTLRDDLLSGGYEHGSYESFVVFDPKRRNIHKATVRDRVVHQAIVNAIEPLFERRFIHDSYSCRNGKGVHNAVHRLRLFLRQASDNHTRTIYALKCDIKRFFASVNHSILVLLLERRIQDEKMMDVLRMIISSYSISDGHGIPLGNLTSQLFANVYLHELDRCMKYEFREKYYLRYCDDFIIVCHRRDHLFELIDRTSQVLESRLGLVLHPKKVRIRTWTQGIDFLGYVLLPQATNIRTRTVHRILKRINAVNMASYLGVCSHADAFELTQVVRTKVALR